MRPQTRLLIVQPQIRLTHRIRTHLLALLLVLAVVVCNTAVRNSMHNMHALLAHLASKCLRQLSDRCATCAICGELRTAS
jgi:uncharacterized membrane protein YqjE